MLNPVPAIDNFLEVNLEAPTVQMCVCVCDAVFIPVALAQFVCVPHAWRVTLATIIVVNAVVSFLLEVRFPDTSSQHVTHLFSDP